MDPAKALSLASDLIAEGADVVVSVVHPGGNAEGPEGEQTNMPAPPVATLRIASGLGISEDGLPRELLDVVLEADKGASVATSDLLLG